MNINNPLQSPPNVMIFFSFVCNTSCSLLSYLIISFPDFPVLKMINIMTFRSVFKLIFCFAEVITYNMV